MNAHSHKNRMEKVNCLLDTGSQMTTIPLSLYESQLSDHPLKSVNNLLDVEPMAKLCLTWGMWR